MTVGTCSCAAGINGSACVHQAAVSLHFHVDGINVPPALSVNSRLHFAELAFGRGRMKEAAFYASLHQEAIEGSHFQDFSEQLGLDVPKTSAEINSKPSTFVYWFFDGRRRKYNPNE